MHFKIIMQQTMIAGSIAVLVFAAVTMENVPSDSDTNLLICGLGRKAGRLLYGLSDTVIMST